MTRHGIICTQNLYSDRTGEVRNEYHFQTENGFYLGALRFPSDGQFVYDAKVLEALMKLLGMRFGFIKAPKRHN